MITRRHFIAACPAVPLLAAKKGYAPRIACQTYVFSQHYDRLKEKLEDRFDDIFASVARAGYTNVQLTNNYFPPERAADTLGLLRKRKLRMPVVYIGGPMHTAEGARATIAGALALADRLKAVRELEAICFNPDPKPKREPKTDGELAIQAEHLNRLGADLRQRNLGLWLHQHAPEMANNAKEWRHALNNTDPKLMGFSLDTHWVLRGGQDVMTITREAGTRIGDLHLRNSKDGVWLEELADGDIDYREVARYLKEIGYRGWLTVELAWDRGTVITRSLEENLRRSLAWIKTVFA
jgi:inosose dehydratase